MSNGIKGFFVPGSMTGSYVANKRNEEGSFKYDTQAIGVGMQKQAALQDLEKSYEETINKAYSSYLANQQAIGSTNMGQGYKELYEEAERENLLTQQEQAASNVANVKAQLINQEAEAQNLIQQQYQAEVAQLDRVARSMSDYLAYVGSLSNDMGTGYNYLSALTGKTITKDTLAEDIYEDLFKAQPTDYTTESGETGMSYSQWLHNQMKDTEEDIAFEQWLLSGGGWHDFQKYAGISKDTTEEGQKYAEIESKRREEYETEIARIEAEQKAKEEAERKAKEEAERLSNPNYQGYIASGGNYSTVKGGAVQMGSTTSTNIGKALDTESKLDSGEWKKGDIIKYNGRYYQIVDYRTKGNRLGKYGHVSYKEINY